MGGGLALVGPTLGLHSQVPADSHDHAIAPFTPLGSHFQSMVSPDGFERSRG